MSTLKDTDGIVVVDGLALGGEGVTRVGGKVFFVAGVLPGERVRLRVVEERARFGRAEVVERVESSTWRREADCRHETADGCGGCGFRHVQWERGLALKTEAALREMRKIAGGVAWPEPSLHAVGEPDRARHRVRFQVRAGRLGLFRRGSHELVDVSRCLAAHDDILAAAERVEAVLAAAPVSEVAGIATVLVERAGEVCWVTLEGRPGETVRAGLMALVEAGLLGAVTLRRRRSVERIGRPWIVEGAAVEGRELTFKRRPGTFAQANPAANQAIRERLHGLLSAIGPDVVMDLFAGSGNLSLVAALTARRVVAVEVDRDGLDGLAASAKASRLSGLEPRRRDLFRGLSEPLRRIACDAVVLDPPRTGAKAVMPGLLEMAPAWIVYVACSPSHLARDVAALGEGYEVASLDVFDMFPRTPHLEMMAALKGR